MMAHPPAKTIKSIGSYHVLKTLGKGAHSSILHVRRSEDGSQYALKLVPIDSPDDLKYLEQAQHEFRVAQMLDHPNLIKVFALETHRNWLFRIKEVRLLIEYVNGRTLDTFPRIPIPQLVQIFVRVADGLVHMHRRKVCHGDLKPNNIMLSRTGEVKIIDYGLAWIKGEEKDRVQGTPEFMAPEQIKHKTVTERSDIFNFGATMYRLVTWRNIPLTATGTELELSPKTWESRLTPVLECNKEAPPALAEVIHRCLAYHSQQRPERASEIQGKLDHLAEELVTAPADRLENWEWQE
jgi:serine/threonine protein kinase